MQYRSANMSKREIMMPFVGVMLDDEPDEDFLKFSIACLDIGFMRKRIHPPSMATPPKKPIKGFPVQWHIAYIPPEIDKLRYFEGFIGLETVVVEGSRHQPIGLEDKRLASGKDIQHHYKGLPKLERPYPINVKLSRPDIFGRVIKQPRVQAQIARQHGIVVSAIEFQKPEGPQPDPFYIDIAVNSLFKGALERLALSGEKGDMIGDFAKSALLAAGSQTIDRVTD